MRRASLLFLVTIALCLCIVGATNVESPVHKRPRIDDGGLGSTAPDWKKSLFDVYSQFSENPDAYKDSKEWDLIRAFEFRVLGRRFIEHVSDARDGFSLSSLSEEQIKLYKHVYLDTEMTHFPQRPSTRLGEPPSSALFPIYFSIKDVCVSKSHQSRCLSIEQAAEQIKHLLTDWASPGIIHLSELSITTPQEVSMTEENTLRFQLYAKLYVGLKLSSGLVSPTSLSSIFALEPSYASTTNLLLVQSYGVKMQYDIGKHKIHEYEMALRSLGEPAFIDKTLKSIFAQSNLVNSLLVLLRYTCDFAEDYGELIAKWNSVLVSIPQKEIHRIDENLKSAKNSTSKFNKRLLEIDPACISTFTSLLEVFLHPNPNGNQAEQGSFEVAQAFLGWKDDRDTGPSYEGMFETGDINSAGIALAQMFKDTHAPQQDSKTSVLRPHTIRADMEELVTEEIGKELNDLAILEEGYEDVPVGHFKKLVDDTEYSEDLGVWGATDESNGGRTPNQEIQENQAMQTSQTPSREYLRQDAIADKSDTLGSVSDLPTYGDPSAASRPRRRLPRI